MSTASVAVFLTDAHAKHTSPDGKTTEEHRKAGQTEWGAADKHLPENTGDKPFELILVEMKTRPAAAKAAK